MTSVDAMSQQWDFCTVKKINISLNSGEKYCANRALRVLAISR